jgi:hypothetical protein
MFNSAPMSMGSSEKQVSEGNYAIVDWVQNNPMNASLRVPVIAAFNVTEEELRSYHAGTSQQIPPASLGTVQRIVLQIVQANYLKDGQLTAIKVVDTE